MELKPGYKQTELGVIPEEWTFKRLGDAFEQVIGGGTPSRSNPIYWGNEIPWVTVKDFATFNPYETQESITKIGLKNSASNLIPKGTIITSTRMALGKAIIYQVDVSINQDLKAIFPKKDLNFKYLYYWFQANANVIESLGSGSTVMGISLPDLKNIFFVQPPLTEQRAIATALSDLDALIGSLDKLIAKKRDIKQAAMQELLTGKRRLPGFSEEWEVKRMGEVCEISMGRTPSRRNAAYWGKGYKWLSIADLQEKVVSESKEEITELAASEMTIIPKGTLLMSFKLSIGRLCFAGCPLFTNEAICSFNKLQADANYLYYALNRVDFSLYGKQAVKGYTLNKESLQLVEVPFPTIPEQTAIAAILSDMDAEIIALEQKRDKTRMLKQGMMQELLTGRIRLV